MAARPIWRGHLRLALVSCPVALWNAKHERNTIRFNQINPETGHRIRMKSVDAETEEEVQRRDLVKGYEFSKNRYLLLTDADFDSVKVESSSVMNIEKFVEAGSIDPIFYNSSYYLAPDGEAGRDVYAVLNQAIAETGKVALARVVIGQRERTIALRAMPGGLVAHTLDEQRDINDARSILGDAAEISTDPEMVQLAKQLIDRQTAAYDPSDLEDRYETRLRAMIDAKLKGEGGDLSEPAEPDRTNVVDLMAALKKSLSQEAAPKNVAQSSAPAKPKRAAAAQAAKPGRNRSLLQPADTRPQPQSGAASRRKPHHRSACLLASLRAGRAVRAAGSDCRHALSGCGLRSGTCSLPFVERVCTKSTCLQTRACRTQRRNVRHHLDFCKDARTAAASAESDASRPSVRNSCLRCCSVSEETFPIRRSRWSSTMNCPAVPIQ